jgi:hypothetical protein
MFTQTCRGKAIQTQVDMAEERTGCHLKNKLLEQMVKNEPS